MPISSSRYVVDHLLGDDLVRSQGSESVPFVPRRGDVLKFDSADKAPRFRVLEVVVEYSLKQVKFFVYMDLE